MSQALTLDPDSNTTFARRSETMISLALLAVIVVLLIPLPSAILDMLLALNLAMSILLLLVTLGATRPLEVSVFPSLLLLLTLYRLSLNVATTRLILLDGDAGRIVSTFGGFIVGGSIVVGIVIFAILVIIQFIVITKGASRISEVNARFVLDAMPGKQMAIDAELNAGSIDDEEARAKRQMLTRESEFFGAMDGAGKYVRGDAIAGLIITIVNIFGGVIIGLTGGLSFSQAIATYATLTIGDGLVTQIPALIIATTAGILVTKASTGTSLGHELGTQMLANSRPLAAGSLILLAIAFTPGIPKFPFLLLAAGFYLFSRRLRSSSRVVEPKTTKPSQDTKSPEEIGLEEFVKTDRVCVEIGAGVIPLIHNQGSKSLPDRITTLRRDMTRKYGLWVPTIRLRDSMQMESSAYQILINGRKVAEGELRTDQLMAINPGSTSLELVGESTKEPAFGLDAKWVSPASKQRAEIGGYTVVDATTVLVTHLGEILRRHAHELLSREDLQKMLDKVREHSPTIVEEIKPDVVRMATLRKVLTNLLSERVPISSLELILESIVHHGPQNKDVEPLTERIREDIGHLICQRFLNENGSVRVVVIEPNLENVLRDCLQEGRLVIQPKELERCISELRNVWEPLALQDKPVALLTDSQLRRPIRQVIERSMPEFQVISYTEIPSELMIEPESIIRLNMIFDSDQPARELAA